MAGAIDERDAVLANADAIWEALRTRLDARIDAPVDATGRWSGKDVYAHLARWQERSIDDLTTILNGGRPDRQPEDEDVLNNRWANEDRALPLSVVRERCLATRETLRALVAGLDDAQWERFGRLFDDITGPHYDHHLRSLGG
jgi:hypothetical protein